jgi:His-Xaa-Ser repeat protein HxsA
MKAYALIAALALVLPAESFAGHKHGGGSHGHSHRGYGGYGGYYGGGRSYYRSYSSCYARPYAYARPAYYPYYSSYYAPSVSFAYTSAPRTYYRSAPVDYSDASSSIEADVQQALKRRGYYDGRVDGDIGPASRAAIRAYQDDRGLRPTGRIDSSLLNSLGL